MSKEPNPNPIRFGLALVIIVCVLAIASTAFGAAVAVTPREAIERAIVDRMGGNISVLVVVLRTDVVSEPSLQAVPDPSARAGQPVRFVLTSEGARKGSAIATVAIEARYAKAARAIARDEVVESDAVEIVSGALPGVAFRRLPQPDEVVGLRARRNIASGEPLTAAVVDVPPVVQSGDSVSVKVKVGTVEVTRTGIASGSGHAGDIIRVLFPTNRRGLKARIIGRGAVEVVQ